MFNLPKIKLLKIKRVFSKISIKKWPSKSQWGQFLKAPHQILVGRERVIFFIFLGFLVVSSCFLSLNFYFKNTEIRPVTGGIYIEGVVGQPRFINPIYGEVSDVDRDLVELIFSGLMKYDENSQIVADLVKDYKILEDGKIYEVYLKENLFWSDDSPLSSDDVIFTIKSIQNQDYKSPARASWLGVEVEKISDLGIRFKLKNPYSPFLENLTLKIIPKKVWENIPSQNFPLAIYNLRPIGSGPYKLKDLKQEKEGKIVSLDLVRNPKYSGPEPYLHQISFRFFDNEEDLIKSYQEGEIKGFSLASFTNLDDSTNFYSLSLPRYFAVFFNPDKSKLLAEKEVRQALNYGTNKGVILEKILVSRGEIINSPILPEIYGFNPPSKIYQFDLEQAKDLLEKAGFIEKETGLREKIIKKEPAFQFKSELKLDSQGKEVEELQKCLAKDAEVYPEGEITGYFGSKTREAVIRFQEKYKKEILEPGGLKKGTGLVAKSTRTKLNELCVPPPEEILPLKFSLTTVDQPLLIEVANLLKNQWQALGVEVEIKTFDISQLEKDVIKKRDYESLLFGEVLGAIPDPFPFWHSVQKKDPGLNLAAYENKKVDVLLEEARQSQDEKARKEKLEKFQDLLIEDAPCLFLYSSDYLYFVSKEIKGINVKIITDPSKRFVGIEEWYIKTRRAWK